MRDYPVAYDVVVVGAGFAGVQALHHFRSQGLCVTLLESAPDVGGTWYWNRYPGARVDLESVEYSIDCEVIQAAWVWSERYAGQAEVYSYLRFVADRLDLRRDMQFSKRLVAANFDERDVRWRLQVTDLAELNGDFLITTEHLVLATGFLSQPIWPEIDGRGDFAGLSAHTAAWPADGIRLAGQRVGVIGTGASGVQVVQTIAPIVKSLSVFQRSATWACPLRNRPMEDEYFGWVRDNYAMIRQLERESVSGNVLMGNEVSLSSAVRAVDVSLEERVTEWEHRWKLGGLHLPRSFSDLAMDEDANASLREFWSAKIRALVDDPETAEKLVPKYPPLTRRSSGEAGYFDAFNMGHVSLVDVSVDPIDRFVRSGVQQQSGALHRLDVVICATGFDAGSGAALRIAVCGRSGRQLSDHWSDGVRTCVGLMVHGFPNMYLLNGPQSPAPYWNPPILASAQLEFIDELWRHAHTRGAVAIEPRFEAEDEWSNEVKQLLDDSLIGRVDSWWVGANVTGKPRRAVGYRGGLPRYLAAARQGLRSGAFDY